MDFLAGGCTPIDLYYGAAILTFSHLYQCYQTEAGRINSLVPINKMIISIHYWYSIQKNMTKMEAEWLRYNAFRPDTRGNLQATSSRQTQRRQSVLILNAHYLYWQSWDIVWKNYQRATSQCSMHCSWLPPSSMPVKVVSCDKALVSRNGGLRRYGQK